MKTIRLNGLKAFGLVVLIWGIPLNGIAVAQSVRIERKDGLTIVRNPARPVAIPGNPKGIRLEPELTIGRENDPDKSMIFAIRAIQVDAGGKIYVLDDKTGQVKVYAPDGGHLRTFGQKGQGPGELQSPSRMTMTPDGNLCFLDSGNSRVSIFSPEGACLKETPMTQWRPFRFLPDSRGFGYGDVLDLKDGVADILAKMDAKLNKVATIATLVIAANPNDKMVAIEMYRLTYQVDRDDQIIWASTGEYEINVVDPDGKPVKKIIRDFDKKDYGKTEKDRLIKQYFQGQNPPADADLFFPPHQPVLYYFILDDEGRFYVRTYEADGPGRFFYDVFDKEGRYFARFALPEEEMLMVVKKGKAYCSIQENKDGIPQVKRYAMIWE
jgi:hypothetical protein